MIQYDINASSFDCRTRDFACQNIVEIMFICSSQVNLQSHEPIKLSCAAAFEAEEFTKVSKIRLLRSPWQSGFTTSEMARREGSQSVLNHIG